MPGLHHLAANIQIKYEDILLHFLFGHTVSTVIPCPELSYLIVRILWLTMLASLDGFQTLLLNEFNALRINRKFFITTSESTHPLPYSYVRTLLNVTPIDAMLIQHWYHSSHINIFFSHRIPCPMDKPLCTSFV